MSRRAMVMTAAVLGTAPAMSGKVIEPTAFQRRVLAIPTEFNLFLGGGRGGGKTTCAAFLILRHVVEHPEHARAIVVRQTHASNSDFADLVEQLMVTAFGAGRVTRNRQEHTIRLDSGAQVFFSIADAQSWPRLQGLNFSLLVADEVGEFGTLRYIDRLRSNLRIPGIRPRVILLANPGGPQMYALAKRYVHGRRPWVPFVADDGEEWVLAPSVYLENEHLDHARYVRQLIASTGGDRNLAASWIEGIWTEAISSAFFGDVLSENLWVPEDEWKPGAGCITGVSIDHGVSAPLVCLFWVRTLANGVRGPGGVVLPRDSIYVIDELATNAPDSLDEGLGWVPAQVSEEVLVRCERWGIDPHGVIDSATGLHGETLIDVYRDLGLYLEKPVKGRIAGWAALKGRMAAVRDGDDDRPWVLLSERCRYLAASLPLLQRCSIRREDVGAGPDHGADALVYAVTHRPTISTIRRGAGIY